MMTDTFTSSPPGSPGSPAPAAPDALQTGHDPEAAPVQENAADEAAPTGLPIVIVQAQPLPPVDRHAGDDGSDETSDAGETPDAGEAVSVIAPVDPLPQPREPRIIAMINQKGGVGKTTSTVNLGAGLSHLGYRVLLIDLDPQAHLTLHMGIDPTSLERSNYDLLTDDDVPAAEVMRRINDNLFVLPAEVNLAGAETEMAPKLVTGRAQRVLKDKLAVLMKPAGAGCRVSGVAQTATQNPTSESTPSDTRHPKPETRNSEPGTYFDYILLDCPPSLGLLTINALSFAKEVFVPMQAHFLALQGLSKLLETVGHIRSGFNADLEVTGVILCMHEKQTLLAAEVSADLNAFLDGNRDQDVPWRHATVLTPSIRRNIKLAESPSFGTTIFDYAPDSNGAEDYRKLAMAVVKQGVKLGK